MTTLATGFCLFGDTGYESQVVRFLLEEKHLDYQFRYIDSVRPDELASLNPYQTLPILTNKDVALYEINVIFEYLEERHQGHRLLPIAPKERAMVRTLAWRIQKDWLSLGKTLLTHPDSFNKEQAIYAKKTLSDTLITLSPVFAKKPFFMSDEFGWCDVLLAPLLWRLEEMGLQLPKSLCGGLFAYRERVCTRPTFQSTLKIADPTDDWQEDF